MIGYIYSIINQKNNKRYIGKTIDLEKRLSKHFTELKSGYHHSHKLQRAYNKYGKDVFKIEYTQYNINSENELNQLEIKEIAKYDSYNNGYNETFGGEGHSSKFSFKESVLIYQIGQRYNGVIHKLAKYYDCDRTTIKNIFNKNVLSQVEYSIQELNTLISKINLTSENLIENYKDNYSKQLSLEQVLGILSTIEIKKFTQSACAQACKVNKDIVNCIVSGKTYKKEKQIFDELSKEEKEKYCKMFCANTDVEKIHFQNKRTPVKNALTQKQVDYILDNEQIKTGAQIARELNISADRVRGIKNRKSYLDLIHNYELRHSS